MMERDIFYARDGSAVMREGERQTVVPAGWTGASLASAADAFFSPDPPPEAVSPRQIRLALFAAGLLDDVEGFVATTARDVRISWETATEWRRSDPMLNAMAASFGLSGDELDELFRAAALF